MSFLSAYLYCSIIFFVFLLISVGFSLFDIHFLVFLSAVVILSWFVSLSWLFALSFHSCFSLLPLFCFVCPLTSFILLPIEILLKAKFLKSLCVFVGIASFGVDLYLFAYSLAMCALVCCPRFLVFTLTSLIFLPG